MRDEHVGKTTLIKGSEIVAFADATETPLAIDNASHSQAEVNLLWALFESLATTRPSAVMLISGDSGPSAPCDQPDVAIDVSAWRNMAVCRLVAIRLGWSLRRY
ncbi:hypothetical protein [Botrimarina sp.]|uniref:hypothetical protein n=1 Tax=Botrimarina sp. TaxID=2795802 RepID=UPI0032EDF31A